MYKQNLNTMKKIFGLVAVVAIAALNVVVSNNNKEAELSDLTLENIEASAEVPGEYFGTIVYLEKTHMSYGRTLVKSQVCPGGHPWDKQCFIEGNGFKIEGRGRLSWGTYYE